MADHVWERSSHYSDYYEALLWTYRCTVCGIELTTEEFSVADCVCSPGTSVLIADLLHARMGKCCYAPGWYTPIVHKPCK